MTDDIQTEVRAAWLYYIEGLTQAEIASRLRLTRLRVNRLLAVARESGLVSIAINSRLQSCMKLERALVRGFGLRDAIVVPTAADPAEIAGQVGRGGGRVRFAPRRARAIRRVRRWLGQHAARNGPAPQAWPASRPHRYLDDGRAHLRNRDQYI